MAWTEKMVEDLRQMWLEGLTASEIAKNLGVSKNSIVGKVHRLCLTARPSPIKRKEDDITETVQEQSLALENAPSEVQPQVCATETSESETIEKSVGSALGIKLVNLDSHTCRWPLGDPRDDDFGFCGKKVKAGQTYCDEHSAMAYVKVLKR